MSNILTIKSLEELKRFLNEKGVMEIATRGKNKRFKTIQKVMIENLGEGQQKELAEKVIQALNKNTMLNQNNLRIFSNAAQLRQFGLLLNGLNLCATCAGFTVMYAKLDQMSAEINQQLIEVKQKMEGSQSLQSSYEFNKVLSEHTNMLDCEKKQQLYSEEQMRQLVDSEYNVLLLLISSYQKEISEDHEALIFSIFSLLDMLTVSLRKFDELYYSNNHKVIGDQNPWHLAHDKWMSVFDLLSQSWFIEKLQDYGFFEVGLTARQTDAYCTTLLEQVSDRREEITDNQALMIAFGDRTAFHTYQRLTDAEISDTVEAVFREAGADLDAAVVSEAFQSTMQQAAMA